VLSKPADCSCERIFDTRSFPCNDRNSFFPVHFDCQAVFKPDMSNIFSLFDYFLLLQYVPVQYRVLLIVLNREIPDIH
jgi:hypothetical protein